MLDATGYWRPEPPRNPAVIVADYVEFAPETFKGFAIHGRAERYATLEAAEKAAFGAGYDAVTRSSSVDNYFADLKVAGPH